MGFGSASSCDLEGHASEDLDVAAGVKRADFLASGIGTWVLHFCLTIIKSTKPI